MRRIVTIVSLVIVCLLLVSCSTVKGLFGKSSSKVEKQQDKIVLVENKLGDNKDKQFSEVSQLSYGTAYALLQLSNPPVQVDVAKELNQRVEAIAGLPTVQQESEMIKLVSNLISNNVAGSKLLAAKDKEINLIQSQEKTLIADKDNQ